MATQVSVVRVSPEAIQEQAVFTYTLVAGESYSFTHGFPSHPSPKVFSVSLVNVIAEMGYVAGDVVNITGNAAVSVGISGASVKVSVSAAPAIINYSTNTSGSVTAANWDLVILLEQ